MIHKSVDGNCYTVKVLVPDLEDIAMRYQIGLKQYLHKKVSLKGLHVGLKYMGYDNDFEPSYIETLIPDIVNVGKGNLPIGIKVNGLGLFESTPEWPCDPLLYMAVEPTENLWRMHKEVIQTLGERVDTFQLAEGDNYAPHITLGIVKKENLPEIRRIVQKSKKRPIVTTVATQLAMRFPDCRTKIIYELKTDY